MGSRKHTYSVAIPVLYNRAAQPVGYGPLPGCGQFATGILARAASTAICNPILMSGGHWGSQTPVACTNEAECAHACLPLTQNHPLSPPLCWTSNLERLGNAALELSLPYLCDSHTCVIQESIGNLVLPDLGDRLIVDPPFLLLPVLFSFDWICFSLAWNICSSISFICIWIYCTGS